MRKAAIESENPRTVLSSDDPQIPTFAECAEQFVSSMESQWRNSKHRAQWRMTLGPSYCRNLLELPVSEINTNDVLQVLEPVWMEKSETASRVRGRIERVLNYAKVKGWRSGENPAMWRGNLENVLPKRQKLARGHHAALPYVKVPAFFGLLGQQGAVAARALEFLILTVTRSRETLEARWDEIDFDQGIWTIPAERMKASKIHRIPLTDQSTGLLRKMEEIRHSDFVFPGNKPQSPLSNMSMHMLLRRMRIGDVTIHGFRSSFRDWVGDETEFPREIAEGCLAHTIGNAVEQAYRRSDALERRKRLISRWNSYVVSG